MPLSLDKNGIAGIVNFSITGNQTIGNTLSVTGVSTLNTTALGATSVTGNLTVSSNTTTSNLSVTGAVLLTTPLPVAQGGTGSSTLTANAVVVGNSTGTGHTFISPGSSGNVLTSNGTTWYSTTVTSFVAGMIILWSGSSNSIPSGWLLCDGTSSTPNLRDRFVVGAGSTYAVGATGGSANAITVSHTHTVTDPGHNHTEQGNYAQGNGYNISGGNPATIYQNAVTGNSFTGITIDSAGSSGTNANLPPYYALCYIMKS